MRWGAGGCRRRAWPGFLQGDGRGGADLIAGFQCHGVLSECAWRTSVVAKTREAAYCLPRARQAGTPRTRADGRRLPSTSAAGWLLLTSRRAPAARAALAPAPQRAFGQRRARVRGRRPRAGYAVGFLPPGGRMEAATSRAPSRPCRQRARADEAEASGSGAAATSAAAAAWRAGGRRPRPRAPGRPIPGAGSPGRAARLPSR